MFKRFALFMLGAIVLIGSPAPALANTGATSFAVFRVFDASVAGHTVKGLTGLSVSNISAYDVVVTVRLYEQNGIAVGTTGFIPTITLEGGAISCNATNTSCTLPAGKTCLFTVSAPSPGVDWFGHGAIEWTSMGTDPQTVALMANGQISVLDSVSGTYVVPMIWTKPQPF